MLKPAARRLPTSGRRGQQTSRSLARAETRCRTKATSKPMTDVATSAVPEEAPRVDHTVPPRNRAQKQKRRPLLPCDQITQKTAPQCFHRVDPGTRRSVVFFLLLKAWCVVSRSTTTQITKTKNETGNQRDAHHQLGSWLPWLPMVIGVHPSTNKQNIFWAEHRTCASVSACAASAASSSLYTHDRSVYRR